MRIRGIYLILIAVLFTLLPMVSACGGGAPATEPTTEPASLPATEPVTEPAITPTDEVTVIPHTLDGRDNCLMCHETGIGEAKAIPADHAGRTNDLCVTCHRPAK